MTDNVVDLIDALDAATDEFSWRLALVPDDGWTRTTPCPGWDVHYLVAHVVGGNRFAVSILGGMSASSAVDLVMSTPQLGHDPLKAWATTSVAQVSAFRVDNALELRIDHPLGEITGREFLELRVFDITLHAWDLARSLAVDEQIRPELIDAVLAIVRNGPPGMGFGIAARGVTGEAESAQARLLDLTGRGAV